MNLAQTNLSLAVFSITAATIDDVDAIRRIAEQTWWTAYGPILEKEQIEFMLTEMYSPEKIREQISSGSQTFLLLAEGEEIVAFAAYSPRTENIGIYKLHKLYCLPITQGKGYGKVLINEVERKTLEAGRQLLELNVNRYNKARLFYEKMGFKIVYEEDVPIGPYWMNDFVMQKELV